jgi:hypothetical protein
VTITNVIVPTNHSISSQDTTNTFQGQFNTLSILIYYYGLWKHFWTTRLSLSPCFACLARVHFYVNTAEFNKDDVHICFHSFVSDIFFHLPDFFVLVLFCFVLCILRNLCLYQFHTLCTLYQNCIFPRWWRSKIY